MRSDKLGEILLAAGKISAEQLRTALDSQEGNERFLGDVLTGLGYVTPEDLARALSVQLRIPFFDLGDDFRLEPEEVALIPEPLARKWCLVPVRKGQAPTLTVVMKDPLDLEAIDTVRSLTSLEVHKAVSTEDRIRAVIDKFYREDAHIERSLQDIVDVEAGIVPGHVEPIPVVDDDTSGVADSDRLRVLANDAPVVRFVNLLLLQAVRDGASDIHFEPGEKAARVRLRVDGALREVTPPPKSLYQAVVTRIKIMSSMDIAEKRLPLDGRFKFTVQGRTIDVRVSSLPEVYGEKIVLRVLDRSSFLVDMKSIGFEDDTLARFKHVLDLPNGIILLTGPTGSGKTTTLYSALNYLKQPRLNIQTVEDPVEYLIEGINQMPVRPGIGLDFAMALRHILRQDPDIIMIGEIRDLETAGIAVRASLTGHLVLSTLHTNDAPSAFWRLMDIGVEPFLVAATVRLVIAQRLVRLICEYCRKSSVPGEHVLSLAARIRPDVKDWTFYRGAGCGHCAESGYRGRTAIVEFLEATPAIRKMIEDETGEVALRGRAIELGLETLQQNGLKAVERGVTTLEEVTSVAAFADMPAGAIA